MPSRLLVLAPLLLAACSLKFGGDDSDEYADDSWTYPDARGWPDAARGACFGGDLFAEVTNPLDGATEVRTSTGVRFRFSRGPEAEEGFFHYMTDPSGQSPRIIQTLLDEGYWVSTYELLPATTYTFELGYYCFPGTRDETKNTIAIVTFTTQGPR